MVIMWRDKVQKSLFCLWGVLELVSMLLLYVQIRVPTQSQMLRDYNSFIYLDNLELLIKYDVVGFICLRSKHFLVSQKMIEKKSNDKK